MNSSLDQTLKSLDNERTVLAESEVANIINCNFDGDKNDKDFVSELIAFNLTADYENKRSGWGYYYGPHYVFKNDDGSITEYPSLKNINNRMINYWTVRMENTKNPIMKARYADLVWEFSKDITGDTPNHTIAQKAIDNIMLIIEKKLYKHEVYTKKKLERALNIALSLNDTVRLEQLKKMIIENEDNIAQDNMLGLWGFSYDLLLDNKKIKLENEEESKIVNDLENRIDRLSIQDEIEPQAIESAAIRLASYYQKNNNRDAVIRVMKKVEKGYIKKSQTGSFLQAQGWMEHLHELLLQFQMAKEAREISKKINELGAKVLDELSLTTHKMELPKDKLNEYVNLFLSDNITEDIAKISFRFVPKKNKVEQQVIELSEDHPLGFLMPKILLNEEGRTTAKIGNLEEDLEGNIIHQITQNLSVELFFLEKVLDKFIDHHTLNADKLLKILMDSPIFEEEKKELLLRGLEMYFDADYVGAIHVLIPQIETAFRRIINLCGGTTLKPSKSNEGFRVTLFGTILSDPIIEKVFDENHKLYFKILFSDQRGLNLRNNISHGLSSINTFNKPNANLLIHVLLTLSLIQSVENSVT